MDAYNYFDIDFVELCFLVRHSSFLFFNTPFLATQPMTIEQKGFGTSSFGAQPTVSTVGPDGYKGLRNGFNRFLRKIARIQGGKRLKPLVTIGGI
jgi:hypothetical protein